MLNVVLQYCSVSSRHCLAVAVCRWPPRKIDFRGREVFAAASGHIACAHRTQQCYAVAGVAKVAAESSDVIYPHHLLFRLSLQPADNVQEHRLHLKNIHVIASKCSTDWLDEQRGTRASSHPWRPIKLRTCDDATQDDPRYSVGNWTRTPRPSPSKPCSVTSKVKCSLTTDIGALMTITRTRTCVVNGQHIPEAVPIAQFDPRRQRSSYPRVATPGSVCSVQESAC